MSTSLCDVCQQRPSKYTCPGCKIRSCSLECVNEHKIATECGGNSQPRPLEKTSDITNDVLQEDFRFLRNIGENVTLAAREVSSSRNRQPRFQKRLADVCRKRGCTLLFMPEGMSRRKENTSYYKGREDEIIWRINWIFHDDNGEHTLSEERVGESTNVLQKLMNFITTNCTGTRREILTRLVNIDFSKDDNDYAVALYREKTQENKYRLIGANESFKEALKDATIVEFPSIHVMTKYQWEATQATGANGLPKRTFTKFASQPPAPSQQAAPVEAIKAVTVDKLSAALAMDADTRQVLTTSTTSLPLRIDAEASDPPAKRHQSIAPSRSELSAPSTAVVEASPAAEDSADQAKGTFSGLVDYGDSSENEEE